MSYAWEKLDTNFRHLGAPRSARRSDRGFDAGGRAYSARRSEVAAAEPDATADPTAPTPGNRTLPNATADASAGPCEDPAPLDGTSESLQLDAAEAAAGGLREMVSANIELAGQARLLPGGDLADTPAGAAYEK